MEALTIVALAVAIPIILLPVAFVWYLQIGGVVAAAREARKHKATAGEKAAAKIVAR